MPDPAARTTAGPPSPPGRGRGAAETGVEAFLAVLGAAMGAAAGESAPAGAVGSQAVAGTADTLPAPLMADAAETDGSEAVVTAGDLPTPGDVPAPVMMAVVAMPTAIRGDEPGVAGEAMPAGTTVPAGPRAITSAPEGVGKSVAPDRADPALPVTGEVDISRAPTVGPGLPQGGLTAMSAPPVTNEAGALEAPPTTAARAGQPDPSWDAAAPRLAPPRTMQMAAEGLVEPSATPDAGSGAGGPQGAAAAGVAAPEIVVAVSPAAPRATPAPRAARELAVGGVPPAVKEVPPFGPAVAAPGQSATPIDAAPPPPPDAIPKATATAVRAAPEPASREIKTESPAAHVLAAGTSPHTSAANSAPAPAPAAAPPPPPPPPHAQIVRALEPFALDRRPDASATLSLRLEPADLGQVEVRLEPARDGTLRVEIIAERPETMALLQRERHDLLRALDRAGLSTNDQPASSTGGGAHSETDRQPAWRRAQGQSMPGRHTASAAATPVLRPAPARPVHRVAGRIDLIA